MMLSDLTVYAENGIFKNASIEINANKIIALHHNPRIAPNNSSSLRFSQDCILVPGFIDLHTHGANGCDVMDGSQTALKTISAALAKEGTTSFLATTMTASAAQIDKALQAVRDYIHTCDPHGGARILGVHLEGPFIALGKAGAQCVKYISPLNTESVERWLKLFPHLIKILTLAPELQHSDEFIDYLKNQNIIAALGHSDATYEEASTAILKGATYATHLFNAMRGIHHREPGLTTAALLSPQVTAELIVDGVHLHPAIVDLALKLKSRDKIVLVTDAMRAKCLQDGEYELGGQPVTVKSNTAKLKNGTLAGSVLKMNSALQNLIQFTHCSLEDAVQMASVNPARVLNLSSSTGSIAVGKDADLVVLDQNLNVVMTIVQGQVVYDAREALVICR